jgi:hypothetical protein
MLKTITTTALLVILGALAGPATGAEPPSLLVRLDERSLREDGFFRTEVLVYRDGAIAGREEFRRGGPPMLRFLRHKATDAQMHALGLALLNNHVGLQPGGCFLVSGNAEEARLQTQVDWFGKSLRQNSFVTDTSFAAECSPEVYAIVAAIEGAFFNSSVIDDRSVEDLLEEIK